MSKLYTDDETREHENWHEKVAEAEARGSTVEAVENERSLKRRINELGGKVLTALARDRADLARKQEEFAARERGHQAAVQAWDRLLKELEQLHAELQQGDLQLKDCKDQLAMVRKSLDNGVQHWGVSHLRVANEWEVRAGGIQEKYQVVLGLEAAIADYPRWRKTREEKLDAQRERIRLFAQKHEVPERAIPSDCR